MEDYDNQIEVLNKTRALLQLINDSTSKVYEDLKTIQENHQLIKKSADTADHLVKSVSDN